MGCHRWEALTVRAASGRGRRPPMRLSLAGPAAVQTAVEQWQPAGAARTLCGPAENRQAQLLATLYTCRYGPRGKSCSKGHQGHLALNRVQIVLQVRHSTDLPPPAALRLCQRLRQLQAHTSCEPAQSQHCRKRRRRRVQYQHQHRHHRALALGLSPAGRAPSTRVGPTGHRSAAAATQ